MLAVDLAEQAGVLPDPSRHPGLAELLLFGPMLPIRYRLDGPGARPDAADVLRAQASSAPRAPLEPDDLAMLSAVGLGSLPSATTPPLRTTPPPRAEPSSTPVSRR